MRIISGVHKGRLLATPAARDIRPTSQRTREAVFNKLAHGIEGFTLENIRVLDLFAGTGALGLEALSRGAAFCMFVETATPARGLIRRNADELGLIGSIKIWRRDVLRLGKCAPLPPFDLIFADPPYGKGMANPTLICIDEGDWLAPGGIVVIEETHNEPIEPPKTMAMLDRRRYGDTQIAFLSSTREQRA